MTRNMAPFTRYRRSAPRFNEVQKFLCALTMQYKRFFCPFDEAYGCESTYFLIHRDCWYANFLPPWQPYLVVYCVKTFGLFKSLLPSPFKLSVCSKISASNLLLVLLCRFTLKVCFPAVSAVSWFRGSTVLILLPITDPLTANS